MLSWLLDRKGANARELYGSSVAAARRPEFYRDLGVADSLEGRFELVTLHVALLLRRLSADGADGKELGRAVVEQMVTAIDDDLRTMGVGDLSVPRHVQGAASAFYGRLKVYDEALRVADDVALASALRRNVPAGARPLDAARLASFARACAAALEGQPLAGLLKGKVGYPEPMAATDDRT